MNENHQDKTKNKLTAKLHSLWQQIKLHRIAVGVTALVIVIVLIIAGYYFDWTGFNGYNKVTTAHSIRGSFSGTVIRTEEYQPGKTLWDWLQLLFIPAILTLGAVWITARQNHDREIAEEQQKTDKLKDYFDQMTNLSLNHNLRTSQPGAEVRHLARAQTLTVLHGLDGLRKKSVVLFLYESDLICKGEPFNPIVDLSGADLWRADLKWINLKNVDFRGALCWQVDFSDTDLSGAYFQGAQLREVVFKGADLSDANFWGAMFLDAAGNEYTTDITIKEQLKEAKSLKGAIMPIPKGSSGSEKQE